MANSYAALGESKTYEDGSHRKGLVLLAFFMGVGCAVACFSNVGHPQTEPISTMTIDAMSYNTMSATRALRGVAPPAFGRMATPQLQFAHTMENVLQQHRGSAHPFRSVRVHAENPKVDEILEQLKSLTLFGAAELVKEVEETFGVSAAVAVAAAPAGAVAGGGAPAEAAEEKTDFDVVLEAVDDSKRVASLKILRTITGLGLKETKDFMSALPKAVKEGASKEEAEKVKAELETVGAKVTIK